MTQIYVARESDTTAIKALGILKEKGVEGVTVLQDGVAAPKGAVTIVEDPSIDWYSRVQHVSGFNPPSILVAVRNSRNGNDTAFRRSVRQIPNIVNVINDRRRT